MLCLSLGAFLSRMKPHIMAPVRREAVADGLVHCQLLEPLHGQSAIGSVVTKTGPVPSNAACNRVRLSTCLRRIE